MRSVRRWDPLELPGRRRWQLVALDFDTDWLEIRICSGELRVRLRWDSQVLVQVRDESDLLGVLAAPGFDFPHPFYRIENSSLIRFFVEDSGGLREPAEIEHFAIYTIDECVDVLATNAPLSATITS